MSRSWQVLRPGGVLVGIAAAPSQDDGRPRGVRSVYLVVAPNRAELAELARLTDAGRLHPAVGRVFPLADAAAAVAALQHEHIRGKVVLRIRPSAG